MIYFDKDSLDVLRTIYLVGEYGIALSDLEKVHGPDKANAYFIMLLNDEDYIGVQNFGKWTNMKDIKVIESQEVRLFCTAKGRRLIQMSAYDFWKWAIPTFISVMALIVSFIALLTQR